MGIEYKLATGECHPTLLHPLHVGEIVRRDGKLDEFERFFAERGEFVRDAGGDHDHLPRPQLGDRGTDHRLDVATRDVENVILFGMPVHFHRVFDAHDLSTAALSGRELGECESALRIQKRLVELFGDIHDRDCKRFRSARRYRWQR